MEKMVTPDRSIRTSEPIRTRRADSIATRQSILDAAELLFSERGYSGTSMRMITDRAGVNLAAINYHFGSKEKLLDAAFQRALAPVNEARLSELDTLEAQQPQPAITDIVRAFVKPILPTGADPRVSQLLAKLFAEPKSISVPLLERTFAPVARRFFETLRTQLPYLDERELEWRIHLVIGAMVHLANFNEPLNVFGVSRKEKSPDASGGLERLIDFAVAGLCQDPSAGRKAS